jgi:hypothetical protein
MIQLITDIIPCFYRGGVRHRTDIRTSRSPDRPLIASGCSVIDSIPSLKDRIAMQEIDTISQVPVEERPGDEKDGELKHLERLENDGSGVHISKTVTAGIASNVEDFWVRFPHRHRRLV